MKRSIEWQGRLPISTPASNSYLRDLEDLLERLPGESLEHLVDQPGMLCPALPSGASLSELDLTTRVRHILKHTRRYNRPEVEQSRIIDLLALPGFGKVCLEEYLRALTAHLRGEQDSRRVIEQIETRGEWRALTADDRSRYLCGLATLLERLPSGSLESVASCSVMEYPALPEGVSLDDLRLSTRVGNNLRRATRYGETHLQLLRIEELLFLPGFGKTALVEYAVALAEYLVDHPVTTSRPESEHSSEVGAGRELQLNLLGAPAYEQLELSGTSPDSKASGSPTARQALPAGIRLNDLQLTPRILTCFRNSGLTEADLRQMTIYELSTLPNFGRQSALDYVEALSRAEEERRERETSAPAELIEVDEAKADSELRQAITSLLRQPDVIAVSVLEPRLAAHFKRLLVHLPEPRPETLAGVLESLATHRLDPAARMRAAQILRDIASALGTISGLCLEDELLAVLKQPGIAERDQQVYCYRYGWDGGGQHVLQEAGDRFGVTRERIRQIAARVDECIVGKTYFLPTLDRILRELGEASPVIEDGFLAAAGSKGTLLDGFDLDVIKHAATTLGRDWDLDRRVISGVRCWGSAKQLDDLGTAWQAAYRSARHWGVSNLYETARPDVHSAEMVEAITQMMIRAEGFRWLDEESGWFWYYDTSRNRIVNQIMKVLSASGRVSVGDLRSAAGRHYRTQGFAPPRRVLLELCRQLPGVIVEGNSIAADPPLDPSVVLGSTEATLANILLDNGGIMAREKLESECLAKGVNRSTFYVFLDYSPIITRYSRGVYGLCGAAVAPGLVESLAPRRRRGKVLIDYGWRDGGVWLAFRMSQGMLNSGTFAVPSAMKKFLEGSYLLTAGDGAEIGTVVCSGNTGWGLGTYFRRRGGEPGDHLLLAFNLSQSRAIATLCDYAAIEAQSTAANG